MNLTDIKLMISDTYLKIYYKSCYKINIQNYINLNNFFNQIN